MAAQKINEGLEHIAKAEKYLKTGFLKWKPDYDSAATEYAKAAVAFKNAKQFDQAKEAYLKEAVSHEYNKALFHAAKTLSSRNSISRRSADCSESVEARKYNSSDGKFSLHLTQYISYPMTRDCCQKKNVLTMYAAIGSFTDKHYKNLVMEMQKHYEAIELIEKASMMYLENGTPDTAALALDRAGKVIENINPSKAIQLYQQTAAVFENEERLRQSVEMYGKASRLLVRGRRLDEAAASLQKEKSIYKDIENYPTCYKKTIAQVLVHLHRNDYVAAEKCVRETYSIPGFRESEDCAALEQLLEGYDQQDQDQISDVCNSPLFKYMDNDYAKLGLSLSAPGGGLKKKSPVASQGNAEGPTVTSRENEEDDEYAGGLC